MRRKFLAEQPAVERLRHDGAAGDGGARHVAAIVRVLSARQELHVGSCAQVVDRCWPGLKIGVPKFAVGRSHRSGRQIAVRLLAAIVEAGGRLWLFPGIQSVPAEVDPVPPT